MSCMRTAGWRELTGSGWREERIALTVLARLEGWSAPIRG